MAANDHLKTSADPGQPTASGYDEPRPTSASARNQPKPDAAGNEASQVAAQLPAEEDEDPTPIEPVPPGEHKREPIKDPDPADTKLHVQQGSR